MFPASAMASAGDSPKYSVFGIIGNGKALSEGAAYGSDQSQENYSPYSVYSKITDDAVYSKMGGKEAQEYIQRKKKILAETQVRLTRIPAYAEKKKWFEVKDELTRYMYETRRAANYLATTRESKEAAKEFFKAIERVNLGATQRQQDAVIAANVEAQALLDQFLKLV